MTNSGTATDADIVKGEKKDATKTMQADGPRMLAEKFVAKLQELGSFTHVSDRSDRALRQPTP